MRIPLVAVLLLVASAALAKPLGKGTITTRGRAVIDADKPAGFEPSPEQRLHTRAAAIRLAREEAEVQRKEIPGAKSFTLTIKGVSHGVAYEPAYHPHFGNQGISPQTPVAFTEMTFKVRFLDTEAASQTP